MSSGMLIEKVARYKGKKFISLEIFEMLNVKIR